jgi:hypothetical protein
MDRRRMITRSLGINMMRTILTTLCLLFASTYGLKAETQEINTLSDGIAAFICDEIDNIDDVPLIFTNDESNWNLSGSTDFSVSKIENGFKFVSSGAEEGFGFLKKISRNEWNFEYLDQKGFYETSCAPQNYFVDLLVEHISPKIIENGNTLVEKLKNANTELTAWSLALEAERKEHEITLTKYAAANALKKAFQIDLNKSFTEVERQAAIIAEANSLLEKEKDISTSALRKLALLNTQTSQLRNQLNELQGLLDESKEADTKAQIQLKMLGTNLNLALARVASEQRKLAAEQRTNATLTEEIESLKTKLHNK